MKHFGILFLGLLMLTAGCGKNENKAAPAPQAAAEPAPAVQAGGEPAAATTTGVAQPADKESGSVQLPDASWMRMEDGRFVAKIVELADPVVNDIQHKTGRFEKKSNTVQVIRPLVPKGDVVGELEFIPEASDRGPILIGNKATAFVLYMKRQDGAKADGKELASLNGSYDLFARSKNLGEVKVGRVEFAKDKATITDLCTGKVDEVICEVLASGGRFRDLVVHEEVIARRQQESQDAKLSEADRARREIDSMSRELADVQSRIGKIVPVMEGVQSKADARVAAAEKERDKSAQELKAERDKVTALQNSMKGMQEKIASVTTQLRESTTTVEEKARLLGEAQAAIQKAKAQIRAAEVQVEKAGQDVGNADKASSKVETKTSIRTEESEEVKPAAATPPAAEAAVRPPQS